MNEQQPTPIPPPPPLPGGVAPPPPPPPPPPQAMAWGTSTQGAPGTGIHVPIGSVISSRGKRFGALLLDLLLLFATLVIGYLIWMLIVWARGQTPAKQLLKMYVVDTQTGRHATWGKMFLRNFVIDNLIGQITFGVFSLVSAIWIFTNPENQRLTDKMANTIVVDSPNGRPGVPV